MKIAVACDHAGFPLKSTVIEMACLLGHEVTDLGTDSAETVDYPDFAEKLLDKVFNAAKEKLASLQKRPDYDKVVAELLREAVTQLKVDQAEVRVDAATQKVLKEQTLSELSKELKTQLSIGKALEDGLGIVINADHGRLHYDNTLETRLNRLQSALRSAVYHVLMGEKL